MARHRSQPDHFARRAKAQGHAARSVFKLEEIDRRWRLLRPGARVLDLGCAPGSWMQYAAGVVGQRGQVIGYDLKAVTVSLPAHAEARVGDIYQLDPAALGGAFDVVLSDMAPSTMGDHTTDALRSAALVESALALAESHLKRGGAVVVKILEGGELPKIVATMRRDYGKVERLRPQATRRESSEIFLVGLDKRSAASAASPSDIGPSPQGARDPHPPEEPRGA